MDEIMRDLQGIAEEVALGPFRALPMRLGMALKQKRKPRDGQEIQA